MVPLDLPVENWHTSRRRFRTSVLLIKRLGPFRPKWIYFSQVSSPFDTNFPFVRLLFNTCSRLLPRNTTTDFFLTIVSAWLSPRTISLTVLQLWVVKELYMIMDIWTLWIGPMSLSSGKKYRRSLRKESPPRAVSYAHCLLIWSPRWTDLHRPNLRFWRYHTCNRICRGLYTSCSLDDKPLI